MMTMIQLNFIRKRYAKIWTALSLSLTLLALLPPTPPHCSSLLPGRATHATQFPRELGPFELILEILGVYPFSTLFTATVLGHPPSRKALKYLILRSWWQENRNEKKHLFCSWSRGNGWVWRSWGEHLLNQQKSVILCANTRALQLVVTGQTGR